MIKYCAYIPRRSGLLCLVSFPSDSADRTEINSYTVFEHEAAQRANIFSPPDYGSVGRLRSVNTKSPEEEGGVIGTGNYKLQDRTRESSSWKHGGYLAW